MATRHAARPARLAAASSILLFLLTSPLLADPYYQLPDAELMSSGFGELVGYGGGSSHLDPSNPKIDVSGPGVIFQMTLAGVNDGKIGIGDDWPVGGDAGLKYDPVLGHDTSLDGYTSYEMWVTYVSGPDNSDIDISLILNTGLTGVSGNPSGDLSNDTFWQSPWTTLAVGETVKLVLDFDAATAYNIWDNKVPHTGGGLTWADGGTYAINHDDRSQISRIGLQIADFDEEHDAFGAPLQIHLNAIPEPFSMAFMASAFVGMVGWRVRRRRRKSDRDP